MRILKGILEWIWLSAIRAYLRAGLFFYFKNINVVNRFHVPKDKPVMFVANHQNALLDALLIATKSGRFSYFLTRAAVFKKPWVSKLLHSLRMLPVYRIRDGWNNLTNNTPIFDNCIELLHNGEAVCIFPEGSHNLKRSVRPLSKGFTRIVFDTLEKYPDTHLQLVPIGFNFEKAECFPDEVSLYVGEAIDAQSFCESEKSAAINNLKAKVHHDISQLTTHIPSEEYDSVLHRLEAINADFLDPKAINTCIVNHFSACEFRPRKSPNVFRKMVHVLFVAWFIVPYLVWKFVVKPKIDEVEFVSTFRFALAITLAPLWLLLIALVLGFGFGWHTALVFIILSLGISLLKVKA